MDNSLLYNRIKKDILEHIKDLNLEEKIPSRTVLVNKYNVTRTTVDRAISELIGEGYLYSKDGSGTYVLKNNSNGTDTNLPLTNNSWGVVLPNIMYDTYPGILRGVEDIAHEHGISVIICNTDDLLSKQSGYIYKLADLKVEGIIIVPAVSEKNDLKPFNLLHEKNIPFIFCNRGIPGVKAPMVLSNNFYGGYILTKHLISCGYRNIAFISHAVYSIPMERYQGYVSALSEAGIDINDDLVIFEPPNVKKRGYESTKMLIKNGITDAIFCYNDTTASGAYDALSEAGLNPGEDIGVAGYDNISICESLPVKLTSVKFNAFTLGLKSAELLVNIKKGKQKVSDNRIIVIQPELVIRQSCGYTKKKRIFE